MRVKLFYFEVFNTINIKKEALLRALYISRRRFGRNPIGRVYAISLIMHPTFTPGSDGYTGMVINN